MYPASEEMPPRQSARHGNEHRKLKRNAIGALIFGALMALYRLANRIFHLDERSAASNLRRLRREVEDRYDFLFSELRGQIVPELSVGSPHMGFATVAVKVNGIYLWAVHDRGYTDWYATLHPANTALQRLDLIFKRSAPPQDLPYYSDYELLRFHLAEIEQVLKSGLQTHT